jgi:hypothetical protein
VTVLKALKPACPSVPLLIGASVLQLTPRAIIATPWAAASSAAGLLSRLARASLPVL